MHRRWKNYEVGGQNFDETFLLEKTKGRDVVDCQIRISILAGKIWVKMKLPFPCEKVAKSMWRAIGVGLQ